MIALRRAVVLSLTAGLLVCAVVAVIGSPGDIAAAFAATVVVTSVAGVLTWRRYTRPALTLAAETRAAAIDDDGRRPSTTGSGLDDVARAVQRLIDAHAARGLALGESTAMLRAVTDALREGLLAIDGRGEVVLINATAQELLRLREPVPFPVEWLPRERALRDVIAAAQNGQESTDIEVQVGDRTLALRARPLGRIDGKAGAGCVLAMDDLTPRQRLDAVRRDFVANVSHELRTPLTIISGVAETLDDDAMPAESRKQFVQMVATNARRMQRIVDDLLDLSRIESGGWLPNPGDVDVRAVAQEIFAPLREEADRKGVTLGLSLDGGDRVYADSTAIRQVLSNLAENALRHTGSGHVTIFTERAVPDDDTPAGGVWLGVRDSGSGIPPAHLERIFERFYRADPGRSREAGGTGLGLAIVKHLAEAHGGRVRATSMVGAGTLIAAYFPPATPRG
ncbi:MAG: ATP-binding protein [Gemmatimonadaceae bacterium]|nr:ATP-binding protein [Gemmatimonadaceae bacterium]